MNLAGRFCDTLTEEELNYLKENHPSTYRFISNIRPDNLEDAYIEKVSGANDYVVFFID